MPAGIIAEITALGGLAGRIQPAQKFLGLLGTDETFVVTFSGAKFDDAALARLATNHGDRIGSLQLADTSVTDDGLRHLKRFGTCATSIWRATRPRC